MNNRIWVSNLNVRYFDEDELAGYRDWLEEYVDLNFPLSKFIESSHCLTIF